MSGGSFDFVGDEFVKELAENVKRPVWGLVVNVLSPPKDEAFMKAYQAVREHIVAHGGNAMYVYPPQALHVTVATLVAFHTKRFDDEDARTALVAAWRRALTREFAKVPTASASSSSSAPSSSGDGEDGGEKVEDASDGSNCTGTGIPLPPFRVAFDTIESSPKAAFFMLRDTTGTVAAIRDCIRRCQHDPELKRLGAFDEGVGFRTPGIVHSSFVRYTRDVGSDGTPATRTRAPGATINKGDMHACLDTAARELWAKPKAVVVDSVELVIEDRPYMHIPRDDAHTAARWAFCEPSDK